MVGPYLTLQHSQGELYVRKSSAALTGGALLAEEDRATSGGEPGWSCFSMRAER